MNEGEASGVETRLTDRELEFARVQKIGQIGGLTVDLRGGRFRNTRSPEYLALHGLPPDAVHETHEDWVRRIHPDDRDRVLSHFLETVRGTSTDYEVEYRIIRPSDGNTRWILAKAEIERGEAGEPLLLRGAHIDVTARKQAEEHSELVARELGHRIANIFAVVNSIVRLAARTEPESRQFAAKLEERFAALHRAHSFVGRPKSGAHGGILKLLSDLLAPYQDAVGQRVKISGEDVSIGPQMATSLALVAHELATNAVKYGALSAATGTLSVTVDCDEQGVRIFWQETGGPVIAAPPERSGFGSTMIDRAARSMAGCVIQYAWKPDGLLVTLSMQPTGLNR
jgi:PAS domain S-box-containing protein